MRSTPSAVALPLWRRLARSAWVLHGLLIAQLALLPGSAFGLGHWGGEYWGTHSWEGPETWSDENTGETYPVQHTDETVWVVPGDPDTYYPLSYFGATLWADDDNDGLNLYQEMASGTDPGCPDYDADGILDGDEAYTTSTSPLTWDTDGDGVSDFDEAHNFTGVLYPPIGSSPTTSSWTYRDWDADGTDNYRDNAPYDSSDSSIRPGSGGGGGGGGGGEPPPDVDLDNDGLTADQESIAGTRDNCTDCDEDLLTDYEEVMIYGSGPTSRHSVSIRRGYGESFFDHQMVSSADSDSDGFPDCIENFYVQNNTSLDPGADQDANGVINWDQYQAGVALDADINRYDQDNDGMSDIYEDIHQFKKYDPTDAVDDADNDKVFNFEERLAHTHPRQADTFARGGEGDWIVFLEALIYGGINVPTLDECHEDGAMGANSVPDWLDDLRRTQPDFYNRVSATDWDGDGLPNTWEHKYGVQLFPNGLLLRMPDAAGDNEENQTGSPSGDGLSNEIEFALGLNPLVADSDGNGVSDKDEDDDGDGLSNWLEITQYHTSAAKTDTDGDGISDSRELAEYSDPNDASSNSHRLGLRVLSPWD